MGFRLAPLPSSRSLQLQSNISITVYWMQQHWTDTRSIERISCFWWKSEIFLSAKPEVELIFIIAAMEK